MTIAASTPMIAITVSNSTNVKPDGGTEERWLRGGMSGYMYLKNTIVKLFGAKTRRVDLNLFFKETIYGWRSRRIEIRPVGRPISPIFSDFLPANPFQAGPHRGALPRPDAWRFV